MSAITTARKALAQLGSINIHQMSKKKVRNLLNSVYVLLQQIQDPIISIPLWAAQEADGTALAAFVDGASTTPGLAVGDSKSRGIRWNNHATPDPIGFNFQIPSDADVAEDMTMYFLASKTGATLADAVAWTCTFFNMVAGALHDADSDFGGDSSAMTGDAAAKTLQLESLTLAAADLPATGSIISATVQPKDGTLGTDDVILQGCYVQYKSKFRLVS